jgi:hypothetical protein
MIILIRYLLLKVRTISISLLVREAGIGVEKFTLNDSLFLLSSYKSSDTEQPPITLLYTYELYVSRS